MGGIFTGGQSQITAILLGWVMDDDEMANEVAAGGGPRRREGLILSANAMIQHMSFADCLADHFNLGCHRIGHKSVPKRTASRGNRCYLYFVHGVERVVAAELRGSADVLPDSRGQAG